MISQADLAAAWASGYWNGTSHTGPLNEAAVAEKNPHLCKGTTPAKVCRVSLKTERNRDASPKSVTASEPTTSRSSSVPQTIKAPSTVRELGDFAYELDLSLTESMDVLTAALGGEWWNVSGLDRFTDEQLRAELRRRGVAPELVKLAGKGAL